MDHGAALAWLAAHPDPVPAITTERLFDTIEDKKEPGAATPGTKGEL